MKVECAFFGPLREAVGAKTVVREVDGEATVGDLLAALEGEHGDLDLLAEGGDERPTLAEEVTVTVDGTHVQHGGGLERKLSDGDVVRLTTAVYGG